MTEWIALHLPKKIRRKVVEQYITKALFTFGTLDHVTLRDMQEAVRRGEIE